MDECLLYFLLGIITGVIVNLIGILSYNFLNSLYVKLRLKSGHFVGVQWQRELFDSLDSLLVITPTSLDDIYDSNVSLKQLYNIVREIKNWTDRDLLMYYSFTKIDQFHIDRDRLLDRYELYDEILGVDYEDYEDTSKKLEKILDKIDAVLDGYLSREINNLQSKTPSIDNLEIATAAAKSKKLDDLFKTQDELTKIRKRVAGLLNSVIDYKDYKV